MVRLIGPGNASVIGALSQSEKRVRRLAAEHGYRIVKSHGDYTLVHERMKAVMYHFQGVGLDDIEAFFS